MNDKEIICTYCHKVISTNPSYEFTRVTKGRKLILIPAVNRQVFPFCTRGDLVLWLRSGQQTKETGR